MTRGLSSLSTLIMRSLSRFPACLTASLALVRRLLPYHVVSCIHSFVLGSSAPVWGGDHRSNRWANTLGRLAEFVSGDVDVRTKYCLELGTGNCTDLAYFLLLCGARYVTTLDVFKLVNYPTQCEEEYARLRGTVAHNRRWLSAFCGGEEDRGDILSSRAAAKLQYSLYDGVHIPSRDESIDFLWSVAVLEHVKEPEALLLECRRVLRTGALMLHEIDLRDHFHLDPRVAGDLGVWGDWLDFLRFGNLSWRLMGAPVNRLRWSDWRSLLAKTGFAIEKVQLRRLPLHPAFDRRKIIEPYRGLPETDLTVAAVQILARKTPVEGRLMERDLEKLCIGSRNGMPELVRDDQPRPQRTVSSVAHSGFACEPRPSGSREGAFGDRMLHGRPAG
jgi:SAM-dependent methyltransferase